MLIAHDVIDSLTKHERFKEALEELAVHPMSEFGVPSVANTFTAHLDAGKRTVRIRIEMVPEMGRCSRTTLISARPAVSLIGERGMTKSLGEALPEAIAKVSELIGQQEAQAKELDAMFSGGGNGNRLVANVLRVKRDAAVAAQQSGDVIAMMRAYEQIKPAIELAEAE